MAVFGGGDDPVGFALSVLDDLFGGRARIHVLDPTTGSLIPAGTDDEVVLNGPGPLHDVLDRSEAVVEHVEVREAASWDPSYRRWLQQGGTRVVAARIEGGGAVVGVLSVVRSPRSRVPDIEDADLVAALAARLGRTISTVLAHQVLSGAPTARAPLPATAGEPRSDTAGITEPPEQSEPPVEPTFVESVRRAGSPEPAQPVRRAEAVGPVSGVARAEVAPPPVPTGATTDLALRTIRQALGLDAHDVELSLVSPEGSPPAGVVDELRRLLADIGPAVSEHLPESGVAVELRKTDTSSWLVQIRPRSLAEGWPERPTIDPSVRDEATRRGGAIDVVAQPDLGWVIELVVPDDELLLADAASNGDPGATPPQPEPGSPDEPGPVSSEPGDASNMGDPSNAGDASPEPGDASNMLVVTLDEEQRVVFCNEGFAARVGVTTAELLDRRMSAFADDDAAWSEFDALLGQVGEHGLAQATVPWPASGGRADPVRWTVSRSGDADRGSSYMCFGVETVSSWRR